MTTTIRARSERTDKKWTCQTDFANVLLSRVTVAGTFLCLLFQSKALVSNHILNLTPWIINPNNFQGGIAHRIPAVIVVTFSTRVELPTVASQ